MILDSSRTSVALRLIGLGPSAFMQFKISRLIDTGTPFTKNEYVVLIANNIKV